VNKKKIENFFFLSLFSFFVLFFSHCFIIS